MYTNRNRFTISPVKEYQYNLCEQLRRIYPSVEIVPEWISLSSEIGSYSPRIDVAIGPFAIERTFVDEYDLLMKRSQSFIEKLIEYHRNNIRDWNGENYPLTFDELKLKNQNARCLFAIEIENLISRKHLIGGAVNASALGRIGVIVAWTPQMLKAAVKLRRYLQFLSDVGKNSFNTTNLLILSREQMLEAVNQ